MLRNKKATVFLLGVVACGITAGLVLSHSNGKADTPDAGAGQKGTDEAKSDLDKLQGTWRVVSSQVGEEKSAGDEVKRRKVTVKGNIMTYDYGTGDRKQFGTLKLDPKTKYLDWNVTSPEGATMLALYEIKGDEWKIGFGNDGVVRPRGWPIGKDDVVWLLVLKRDEPKGASNGGDQKALQGTWVAVAGENSREKFNKELKDIRLVFQGDKLTLRFGGDVLDASYKLDPSRKPKVIDLTSTGGPAKGETMLGIYALDGGDLKLCFSERGQERPTEFAAEGKPGLRTLLILRHETGDRRR